MANNFEYYSPTRVIFGKGTESDTGKLVKEYGGRNVLLVYGGKSAVRSGLLDTVKESLAEAALLILQKRSPMDWQNPKRMCGSFLRIPEKQKNVYRWPVC